MQPSAGAARLSGKMRVLCMARGATYAPAASQRKAVAVRPCRTTGEVDERFKSHAWKACEG